MVIYLNLIVAVLLPLGYLFFVYYLPRSFFFLSLPGRVLKHWQNVARRPLNVEWLERTRSGGSQAKYKKIPLTRNAKRSPNIVLIVADDLGFNDIQQPNLRRPNQDRKASSSWDFPTPHIQALIQAGVHFRVAYAGHATCSPSRAALLTGRMSSRFGFEYTPIPENLARVMALAGQRDFYPAQLLINRETKRTSFFQKEVDVNQTMLPQYLKDLGYQTFLLGKWDSGWSSGHTPIERGFDESLCFNLGASMYALENDPEVVTSRHAGLFDDFLKAVLPFYVSHNNGPKFRPSKYMTDYLTEEAVQLLHALGEQRKEGDSVRPFFLNLMYNAPHNPFQALREDFEDPHLAHISDPHAKVYASMIRALDRGVGSVIKALEDTDLLQDTMVIFTSDNGAADYVGLEDLNKPFRGWKASFFEGGLRVPLAMMWKGHFQAGVSLDVPVSHMDLLPTILSLAASSSGINLDSSLRSYSGHNLGESLASSYTPRFDGTNLNPLLPLIIKDARNTSDDGTSLKHFLMTERTLFWRSGYYKALRRGRWKLQISSKPNRVWFYDLANDPAEQTNLAWDMSIRTSNDIDRMLELPIQGKRSLLYAIHPLLEIHSSPNSSSPFHHALVSKYEYCKHQLKGKKDVPSQVLPDQTIPNLLLLYCEMIGVDESLPEPAWKPLVESPLAIDKSRSQPINLTDEFVYWLN